MFHVSEFLKSLTVGNIGFNIMGKAKIVNILWQLETRKKIIFERREGGLE